MSTGFNIKSFIQGDPESKNITIPAVPEVITATPETPVKRKNRKPKFDSDPVEPNTDTSMTYIQQNIPYENAYKNTNEQLDETIQQLNALSNDAMADLAIMRSSKTLKNKYMTIGNMIEQNVSIINAKLTAIKEKNKVINDINNLEIKRIKDLKIDSSQEDADAKIANMYNAFINTPVGTMGGGTLTGGLTTSIAPAQNNMLLYSGAQNLSYSTIQDPNYTNNQDMTPAQRRMLLQAQNTMDTVLIYDESNGSRRFAAIDKNTGMEIPNVEVPSEDSAYELDINPTTMLAKDQSRNVVYPMKIINGGSPSSINMY